MLGEANFLEFIEDKFAWLVVVALNLINHYFHLLVHLLLQESTVEGDINQQIDGFGKMLFQEGAVEYRLFLACISI